jgi:hypothetical protein
MSNQPLLIALAVMVVALVGYLIKRNSDEKDKKAQTDSALASIQSKLDQMAEDDDNDKEVVTQVLYPRWPRGYGRYNAWGVRPGNRYSRGWSGRSRIQGGGGAYGMGWGSGGMGGQYY